MIGEKIHHYRITRLIGEGGMASVYEALHEKLQSKVAIKVLNPILTANANIRQRFENEARFMAGLNHTNITRVIDYEERPDLLAIVMEFLEGEDLNVIIKKHGPMPLTEAIPIFLQALDAFEYAHQKGIVHRDVKPSNIFIEPSGTAKILDFGIAKIVGGADDMTVTGTQMGTPVYMSPEQVNTDKNIDHRSDIYSLAVTLFYMLNGKPPYDVTTTSSFQIYTRIVHEALPLLGRFPEIDEILKKATHKDRTLRYQTCRDFRQALIEDVKPPNSAPDKQTEPRANDDDKTLIDILEPSQKEKKPAKDKKVKQPIVETTEKKIVPVKKIPNSTKPKSKTKSLLYSGFVLLGVVIVVLLKIYPSLLTQVFNPSEIARREELKMVKARQYLQRGKHEFQREFSVQNFDSAVFYLQKAAELDQENPEINYFLGEALYRIVSKDGVDLTGLSWKAITKASDAIEKTIQLDPSYTNELRMFDPHSRLTNWWGELALHYLALGANDSALIAYKEGKKRGAFNDVNLEFARNTMNSCENNSLLFLSYDITYHPILYLQNVEKFRTDIKPLLIGFFETTWYFNYITNTLGVPVSFGETWFSLMYEKHWENKLVSVENVNSNQSFLWWLKPDNVDKLTKRSQLLLDIFTVNKFSKPVCFSIAYDQNYSLSLSNLHPEGWVYKVKPEARTGRSKLHQLKLSDLSYEAIKNSNIPSFELRAMFDFIRTEYLHLINELYDSGDSANAVIFKNQLVTNLPLSNYPFYYKTVDTYYHSTINKIGYTNEQRHEKEKNEIRAYLQKNNFNGTPTPSGLYYIAKVTGSGARAMPGKTVKVHYTGTLLDGTKFDSSYDRGEPIIFELGKGQMIKGWEEGIAMMNVGSKGLLIIPYDLGYGSSGSGNLIPAYSALVFDVELIEVI